MADITSRLPTQDQSDGVVNSTAPSEAILTGGSDGTNLRAIKTDSNGDTIVVGNVANQSTDSGNPVKAGAVYNQTPITASTGQRTDLQSNIFGQLGVQFRTTYKNLTGNATTTIKTGAGVLHGVTINNNTTGGVVTIYDSTTASGTIIMTLQVGTPSGGLLSASGLNGPSFLGPLGIEYTTGLTVVTTGSTNNNITITYW